MDSTAIATLGVVIALSLLGVIVAINGVSSAIMALVKILADRELDKGEG